MILKNMKNWLKFLNLIQGNYNTGLYLDLVDTLTSCGNVELNKVYLQDDYIPSVPICSSGASFITSEASNSSMSQSQYRNWLHNNYYAVGNGTTPVTENDYKLENIIKKGITNVTNKVTQSISLSEDGKTSTRTAHINLQFTNSGSEAITVSEVGLYQYFNLYIDSYAYAHRVLIHREVLDEPLNIEVGEVGTVQFKFTFTNSIA